MGNLITLLLKLPRDSQVTPEAAKTFLSTLVQANSTSFFQRLTGTKPRALALEIALVDQQIRFQITCDQELAPFIETQLVSNYPLIIIEKVPDPIEGHSFQMVNLRLRKGSFYPLTTYESFQDVDPMSSVISVLSRGEAKEMALVQIALASTSSSWQDRGANYAAMGLKNEDGTYQPRSDEAVIKEKIAHPGFQTSIRLAATSSQMAQELANAFGVFGRADGNSFATQKVRSLRKKTAHKNLVSRLASDKQVLNIQELATLWHLPGEMVKTLSIVWGTSVLSEPPENLPVALEKTAAEKATINFFAQTQFRNRQTIFGLKDRDRSRHTWAIGKTGTGKSTLIANMAIDDFKKGRGVAVIDPHGDLSEILLDYIPSKRINDTIYFNPADRDFPITINPMEVTNHEEAELVVSGLMSIFTKVWAGVWSARMEYILRNAFLTLTQVPQTTLEDVIKILSDQAYRKRVLPKVKDRTLVHFWTQEFEKMPDRLQKEAIAPIQNKVGQFVTSPLVRNIISNSTSSIKIEEIMNQGKILLINLSQGKLGEDNSSLLGAMLITKMQLAAIHRIDKPEEQRRDFFLYVDEFQNFATESFIKILSEARKYRLNLMLANQYIAQIPEEVRKALLGNVGTLVSFAIGAEDAFILEKEFAEVFSQKDLVNLANYQIALKLMIDGHSSRPFLANTLPLPVSKNQNREKIIKVSRERWSKKKR